MSNWMYGLSINEAMGKAISLMEENVKNPEIELKQEIKTLNERIKYLEEAILELEGDKNA